MTKIRSQMEMRGWDPVRLHHVFTRVEGVGTSVSYFSGTRVPGTSGFVTPRNSSVNATRTVASQPVQLAPALPQCGSHVHPTCLTPAARRPHAPGARINIRAHVVPSRLLRRLHSVDRAAVRLRNVAAMFLTCSHNTVLAVCLEHCVIRHQRHHGCSAILRKTLSVCRHVVLTGEAVAPTPRPLRSPRGGLTHSPRLRMRPEPTRGQQGLLNCREGPQVSGSPDLNPGTVRESLRTNILQKYIQIHEGPKPGTHWRRHTCYAASVRVSGSRMNVHGAHYRSDIESAGANP